MVNETKLNFTWSLRDGTSLLLLKPFMKATCQVSILDLHHFSYNVLT